MLLLVLVVLGVLILYQFGKFLIAKDCGVSECSMVIGVGPVIYQKNDVTFKLFPIYAKVYGYKNRNAAPVLGGIFLIYLLSIVILFGYNMVNGVPTNKVLSANPDSNVKIGDVITEDYGGVIEVKRGNKYLRYVLDEPVQIEFVKTQNPFKVVSYSVTEIVNAVKNIVSDKPGNNAILEVVWYETVILFIVDLFGWFLRWLGVVRIKGSAKPEIAENLKNNEIK